MFEKMLTFIAAMLLALPAMAAKKNIVLAPMKSNGPEACLIIIQGADIPNEAYVPLAKELQFQSPMNLWIGIPHFPMDYAEPLVLDKGIQEMLADLSNAGMNTSTYFYAGHSLGGAMIQLWVDQHVESVTGQLLLGSFLTRVWKKDYIFNYNVPTMTIGGELDGLARVTRIAEAYYTQITDSSIPDAATRFPVTVLEGVSHMQFASGEIPSLVLKRDLIPEVEYSEAHKLIAADMNVFMNTLVDGVDKFNLSKGKLNERLQETSEFIDPILQALHLEGYHNFRPPCLCGTDVCEPMSNCTAFCPFTQSFSQPTMGGGLPGLTISDRDSFHDVWETEPTVHLAQIYNSCETTSEEAPCELQMSTITQGVYHNGEDLEIWKKHFDVPGLDFGYFPISAVEMRTKMISRQQSWTHAGVDGVQFEDTDGGGARCSEINQKSIDWAQNTAGARTIERFYSKGKGQPYIVGPDKDVCPAGPCWIWQELQYVPAADNSTVQLISPQFVTATDFKIPKSAGFHYCKVLSPARALEWLYVDGLRQFGSLASQRI